MHILIIPSEQYVPPDNPLAGIFQHHQAHALKRAGYKVGVISPHLRSLGMRINKLFGWQNGIKFEGEQGISVYRYYGWLWTPYIRRGGGLLWLRAGMILFKKYIEEHGVPDIIHAHNTLNAGILANLIKKKYGIKYLITEHSSGYARGLVPHYSISSIRQALNEAETLIVVSPKLGELLKATFKGAIHSLHWVSNILDSIFEKNVTANKQNKDNVFRFLNIGSLEYNKGQIYLLEAFASNFKAQDNVELRIGGDGPMRMELEELTYALGIEKQIIFLGHLSRDEVLTEMNNCDVFVLPSIYETFGVVLIEALACGKPVIATKSEGPECIVSGDNGVLVPVKDPLALGEAMELMRKNIGNYDPVRLREDCIAKFGEREIVSKLSAIYERLHTKS